MACQIIKNENGKIENVLAENGKQSLLFSKLSSLPFLTEEKAEILYVAALDKTKKGEYLKDANGEPIMVFRDESNKNSLMNVTGDVFETSYESAFKNDFKKKGIEFGFLKGSEVKKNKLYTMSQSAQIAEASNAVEKNKTSILEIQIRDKNTVYAIPSNKNMFVKLDRIDRNLDRKTAEGFIEGLQNIGINLFEKTKKIPNSNARRVTIDGVEIVFKDRHNTSTGKKLKGLELDKIISSNRGKGKAREALRQFLDYTDRQGEDVYLFAKPLDNTTTEEGLISFYESMGFNSLNEFLPQEMVRKAKKLQPQFSIIGEKGAQNKQEIANRLTEAISMLSEGKSMDEIEISTGWYQENGSWKYLDLETLKQFSILESLDTTAGKEYNLEDVIGSSNRLFDFYPQFKNIKIEFYEDNSEPRILGENGQGRIRINTARSVEKEDYERHYGRRVLQDVGLGGVSIPLSLTLTHEIIHSVQAYEGFPLGGNFFTIYKEGDRIIGFTPLFKDRLKRIEEKLNQVGEEDRKILLAYKDILEYSADRGVTEDKYRYIYGEVEAIALENLRMDYIEGKLNENTLYSEIIKVAESTRDLDANKFLRIYNVDRTLQTINKTIQNYGQDILQGRRVLKRFSQEEHRGIARGGKILSEYSVFLSGLQEADSNVKFEDITVRRDEDTLTPDYPFSVEYKGAFLASSKIEDYQNDPITMFKVKQRMKDMMLDAQYPELKRFAKENGYWIEDLFSRYGKFEELGAESMIFFRGEDNKVTKITADIVQGTPQKLLDKIIIHNTLFPATAYKVLGFGNYRDDTFQVVLEQPLIKAAEQITAEETDSFMEKLGFVPTEEIYNEQKTYTNGDVTVKDLHAGNILKDVNGVINVIDPIVYLEGRENGLVEEQIPAKENTDLQLLEEVYNELQKTGLVDNTYFLTNAEIENKLRELGYSEDIVKQVSAWHNINIYKVSDNLEDTSTITLSFDKGEVTVGEVYGLYDFLEEFEDNFNNSDFFIEIQDLKIKPEFQGVGEGSKLLKDTITYIQQRFGGVDIYLNASPIDNKALNARELSEFYAQEGFIELEDEGSNITMLRKGSDIQFQIIGEQGATPQFMYVNEEANLNEEQRVSLADAILLKEGNTSDKVIKELTNWYYDSKEGWLYETEDNKAETQSKLLALLLDNFKSLTEGNTIKTDLETVLGKQEIFSLIEDFNPTVNIQVSSKNSNYNQFTNIVTINIPFLNEEEVELAIQNLYHEAQHAAAFRLKMENGGSEGVYQRIFEYIFKKTYGDGRRNPFNGAGTTLYKFNKGEVISYDVQRRLDDRNELPLVEGKDFIGGLITDTSTEEFLKLMGLIDENEVSIGVLEAINKYNIPLKFLSESLPKSRLLKVTTNGFLVNEDGQENVYVNMEARNPTSVILHEYSHSFLNKLKQANPEMYQRGIELARSAEAKEISDFIKVNQPNLIEGSEAFANEVLAEISGRRAFEILSSKEDSEIKTWLQNFFDWIRSKLGLTQMTNEQVATLSLEGYADAIGVDLMRGEELFQNRQTRDEYKVGYRADTEQVARERFDIPNLEQVGKGSDRTVFKLDDDKVLKVAHSARGLSQNYNEGDYYLSGLVPEVYERGLNYVVVQETPRITNKDMVTTYDVDGNEVGETTAGQMIKDLSKYTQRDFNLRDRDLQDVIYKYGFQDILSYDVLYGDFSAKRNWGYLNGQPVHLDGGTFGGVQMIEEYKGVKNLEDAEFRDIYYKSREAKKQFGDSDKYTMFQQELEIETIDNPQSIDQQIEAMIESGEITRVCKL